MDDPRAWWEWVLMAVIALVILGSIIGFQVRSIRRKDPQFPMGPKKKGPGAQA